MTPQDLRNFDIIKTIVERYMGYDEESLTYFKKELYEPFIDEEFSKVIGADRRARWPITITEDFKKSVKDEAVSIFANYFHSFRCVGCSDKYGFKYINDKNVMDNTILIDKNEIKIKKYMSANYLKSREAWEYDVKTKLAVTLPHTEEEIDKYIVKAFEEIGTIKKPTDKNFELVFSCNFADYMMSSTKQSWTSCYDLEKGGYWYGVPGLIGDKDRAIMYITDGRKKNFMGIEVDNMISRSWVFITSKNKKAIVKFYPSTFYNVNNIKEVTKDNSYFDMEGNDDKSHKGKNDIHFLFFDKAKIASTTSNDVSSIEKIDKNGFGRWTFGSMGGIQFIDKEMKKVIPYSGYNNSTFFSTLEKNGRTYDSYMKPLPRCSCGNTNNLVAGFEGKMYCRTCFDKQLFRCSRCAAIYLLEKKISIEGRCYCEKCAPIPFTCPICGANKIEGTLYKGVKICVTCYANLPHCRRCAAKQFTGNMVIVHDIDASKRKHRCKECAEAEWPIHKYCPQCHELWPENRLIYDGGVCKNCHDKK